MEDNKNLLTEEDNLELLSEEENYEIIEQVVERMKSEANTNAQKRDAEDTFLSFAINGAEKLAASPDIIETLSSILGSDA